MLQVLVKIWRFLERWGPSLFAGFLAFILLTSFPGVAGVLFGLALVALVYAIDTDHLCGRYLEQVVDKIIQALRSHTPEERGVVTGMMFLLGAAPSVIIGLVVCLDGAAKENGFLKGALFAPTLWIGWNIIFTAVYISNHLQGDNTEETAPEE